jgi:uncharacterized repeat protein (TIGR03803 family)
MHRVFANFSFAMGLFWTVVACAQTFTTLHSFTGSPDGQYPYSINMTQGRDGALYGTTIIGGASGYGTVFRITPSGNLKLYSFDSSNGGYPDSGPVLGTNGLFYGTADGYYGGLFNDGKVFSLDASTGTFATLHAFDSSDGRTPDGPVVLGPSGNYYGTVAYGGAHNDGTIYSITPSGTFTLLHNFHGPDGTTPQGGGLVAGPGGILYGVANYGGASGLGTIFSIKPSGAFSTVFSFDGAHGSYPNGTLLIGNDGNFYGSTTGGGASDSGTVFQLSLTGPVVTVLHSFSGTDGAQPSAGLTQATDGKLYGTTYSGGTSGNGTIFSITTAGDFVTLHNFDSTDGAEPNYLMQHTNGKLYGSTNVGGSSNYGTVFSFDVGLGSFVTFVVREGRVGSTTQILGTGLTGATAVTFNGVPATVFNVYGDSFLVATVPTGATTGTVQVTTPGGILSSTVAFRVAP